MKRVTFIIICLLVTITVIAQTDYREGEVIVKFKGGTEVVIPQAESALARGMKSPTKSPVVNDVLHRLN